MKIKEASYIHAEAFSAGELKHGTIALIGEEHVGGGPWRPRQIFLEKMMSNIMRSRLGAAMSSPLCRSGMGQLWPIRWTRCSRFPM